MARHSLLALIAASALATTMVMPPAHAGTPTPAPQPPTSTSARGADRFIVTYTGGAKAHTNRLAAQKATAQNRGRTIKTTRLMGTGAEVIQLDAKLDAAATSAFMAELKKQPGVADVEIDRLLKPSYVPNDTYYGKQWDMKATAGGLNVEPLRGTVEGNGVVVAVIDTGITNHSDLNANVLPGYDFISDSTIARDGNGRDSNPADMGDWVETTDPDCAQPDFVSSSWHGSHVSGTIAAVTNNSKGVAGVAPGAKILPVRVLGRCGGYTSDITDGMMWAAGLSVPGAPANPNPAKVINMSLGGSGSCSLNQQNAINSVVNAGTTIVVAAGNESRDASLSNPGNCSGVINVAANGPSGAMAYYSNYGSRVDVMAAGGDERTSEADGILSTVNTGTRSPSTEGYAYMQGTSMATPHVAGVAALLYSAKPGITPAQVKSTIKSTTRPASCSLGCGTGIVDATKAVSAVTSVPDPGTDPVPPVTGNAIVNGGFENGTTPWTGDTADVIVSGTQYHTGTHYAWLLGYGYTMTQRLGQKVTVPTNGKLTFWLKTETQETTAYTAYDRLQVQLYSSTGSLIRTVATFSNLDAGPSYVQKTYDLSAYAGQSVELRFTGSEDSSQGTQFFLDDVSLAGA